MLVRRQKKHTHTHTRARIMTGAECLHAPTRQCVPHICGHSLDKKMSTPA